MEGDQRRSARSGATATEPSDSGPGEVRTRSQYNPQVAASSDAVNNQPPANKPASSSVSSSVRGSLPGMNQSREIGYPALLHLQNLVSNHFLLKLRKPAAIEAMGFHLGQKTANHLFLQKRMESAKNSKKNSLETQRDVMKFICREWWTFCFGKQADRLQVNRDTGGFVIWDTKFLASVFKVSFVCESNAGFSTRQFTKTKRWFFMWVPLISMLPKRLPSVLLFSLRASINLSVTCCTCVPPFEVWIEFTKLGIQLDDENLSKEIQIETLTRFCSS